MANEPSSSTYEECDLRHEIERLNEKEGEISKEFHEKAKSLNIAPTHDSSRNNRADRLIEGSHQKTSRSPKNDNFPPNKTEVLAIEVQKPVVNEVYEEKETKSRNKRLFSSLMGHLGSARQRYEKDKTSIDKQSDLQASVCARSKGMSEKYHDEKQEQLDHEKQIHDKRIDDLRRERRCKEIQLANINWKKSIMEGYDYIHTTAEPVLLFLPATHTDITLEMLNSQQRRIQEQISQREREDEVKLAENEGNDDQIEKRRRADSDDS